MIILEKFFLQHIPHHKDNVEYWVIWSFGRVTNITSFSTWSSIFTPFSQMVMIQSKQRSY
jgi:hypothetical protein